MEWDFCDSVYMCFKLCFLPGSRLSVCLFLAFRWLLFRKQRANSVRFEESGGGEKERELGHRDKSTVRIRARCHVAFSFRLEDWHVPFVKRTPKSLMFCAPSSVERVSETWCQICRRNILLRSPEFYTLHSPVDFVPYAAAADVFSSTLLVYLLLILLLLITNDEYSSKMVIINCDNKVCMFNNCLLGLYVCPCVVCHVVW